MSRAERRAVAARARRRERPSSASSRRVVFDVADVGGRRIWLADPATYGHGHDFGIWLDLDEYDAGELDDLVGDAEIVAVATLDELPERFGWFKPYGG